MAVRYVLVADNGRGYEEREPITVDPPSANLVALSKGDLQAAYDFDATLQSIAHIIAFAMRHPVWAKGRIRLLDGDRLIHEMPPKEAP